MNQAENKIAAHQARPLVLDIDGTLLKTNLLLESLLVFIKTNPLRLL